MLRRNLPFVLVAFLALFVVVGATALAQDDPPPPSEPPPQPEPTPTPEPTTASDKFCTAELTMLGSGGVGFINNYFTTDLDTTGMVDPQTNQWQPNLKASPGEILHFRVAIKNTSGKRLISTSAIITSSEPKCIFSYSAEASDNKLPRPGHIVLPELAPDEQVEREFWVGVPLSVAPEGDLTVTVTVGDTDFAAVSTSTKVPMEPAVASKAYKAPGIRNIKLDDDNFGDSDGNSDGLPQLDERVEFRFEIGNAESVRIADAKVIVRSLFIEFSETHKDFERLEAAKSEDTVDYRGVDFAGRIAKLPKAGGLPVEISVLGKLEAVDDAGKVVSVTDSSWTYSVMLPVSSGDPAPTLSRGVLELLSSYVDAGAALHNVHALARGHTRQTFDEYRTALGAETAAMALQGGDPELLAGVQATFEAERAELGATQPRPQVVDALRYARQRFYMSAFTQRAQWGGLWNSPIYVRSVDPFGLEGLSDRSIYTQERSGLRWTPRTAELLLATLYGGEGWQSVPTPEALKTHSYIKEIVAASLGSKVNDNMLVRQEKDSVLVTVTVNRGVGALGAANLKIMFLCTADFTQCRLLFTHAKDYAVRIRR